MGQKSAKSFMTTIGKPLDRVDGALKVQGRAPYTGDVPVTGLLHAVVVQSSIASGRISKIEAAKALALPGVLAVFSHVNRPYVPIKSAKPEKENRLLLADNRVFYHGQIVAVVVAESFEIAEHAASLVKITYRRSASGALTKMDTRKKALVVPAGQEDGGRGDVKAALKEATHKITATYITPTESHNPMEPFATTAVWHDGALTVYDSTQAISNTQKGLMAVFNLPAEKVRVIAHYVGGGFGCKLSSWSHVTLAAMAAHNLQRPVKLVLGRKQMFGPVGFRPRTVQTLTLAAKKNGFLTAIKHATISETSKFVEFIETASAVSLNTYACKNVLTSQHLSPLDIGKPTWMRAPGHSPGSFALESAMDELAYELKMDPLQLRIKNYAETDQDAGLPWSSNALLECYKQGAERFGWHKRKSQVGAMRQGDLLIGMGMATAVHSCWRNPSHAAVKLLADGTAVAQAGTQEIGTGTYTVMAQIAAETLGLSMDKVTFELGDSNLPQAPLSGGSTTAGSVGPAVALAAQKALDQLIKLAVSDSASPLYQAEIKTIVAQDGKLKVKDARSPREESFAAIIGRTPEKIVQSKIELKPGDEEKHYSMSTFGAQFVEVAVDPLLGLVKVLRVVGAYSGGRILNAKTAHSQMVGGIIFGIGMALMEQTVMDHDSGRYVNNSFGEYYVPVNADIADIDAFFVDDEDAHINALGVKGVGELGITGIAAAVANAVYHATGKRVRDLPITIDKLI